MTGINAFGATPSHYDGAGMKALDSQAFAKQADQCGCPETGGNQGGGQFTTLAVGEEDGGSCGVSTPPPPSDCGHDMGGSQAEPGATPYFSPYTNGLYNAPNAGSSLPGSNYAADPYGMPASPWLNSFGYTPYLGGSYVDAVLNALYSPEARQGVYRNQAAYEANLAQGSGANALSGNGDNNNDGDAGNAGDATAEAETDSPAAEAQTITSTSGDDTVTIDADNNVTVEPGTDGQAGSDAPVTIAQFTPAEDVESNDLDLDGALDVLKELNLIDDETAQDIAEGLMAPSEDVSETDEVENSDDASEVAASDDIDEAGDKDDVAAASGDGNDADLDADLDEELDDEAAPEPSGDELS